MKIFIKIIIFLCINSFIYNQNASAAEKIKIGLLVPMSGEHAEMGKSIVKSIRMAINKIDNPLIEIVPKDTNSNPNTTLKNAQKLKDEGVKIIIGPIFNKNLIYLDEVKDVIFISLTNKSIKNSKNIISAGINSTSQMNTISKFIQNNKIKDTIILIPEEDYKIEIKMAVKKSNIKNKIYYYDSAPTKLTKQIEKITEYDKRKNNLKDEIVRLESSNDPNKEKKIERLNKKDTLGKVKFDSVIIADFDENLKSITTSLFYTDVSPKDVYFITLNQWFDESLLYEVSSQPIYFPSINYKNYKKFIKDYYEVFKEYPNQLSFLSYDLIGLVYYSILQNNFIVDETIFIKKNKFKGKIGIFEIKKNKINHILNFYKVEDGKFKKIF